jgi:hypothetical protein
MAPNRLYDYSSLLFVHNSHEFTITAVPDGADVLLHIADQHGRMLLPVSTRVLSAKAPYGRCDFPRRDVSTPQNARIYGRVGIRSQ